MKEENLLDPVTPDEALLLKFQEAKVRYEGAALMKIEDLEYEHEYCQAMLALDNLQDQILKDLAKDAQGVGKRADEATQELFELSLRIKNLYPLISLRAH